MKEKTVGKWVLFAFSAPLAILSWFLGALSMACLLAHKPRFEGAGILTLKWREWFATGADGKGKWKYSTTLGRTIWFQPDVRGTSASLDERLERHERVHVRQFEDSMVLSFIIGFVVAIGMWANVDAAAGFIWWLSIWTSGALWLVPNFLTAGLRYGWKHVYRDSEHERSAYAQTDKICSNCPSWWEHRDAKR